MLSFWEKQSLLNYDLIIVGSGIVGLSTAISVKEKDPAKSVLVLERGVLPTGASTKNAGFACIGSLTEILDDLEHMSEDEVLSLVELRLKGLKKLRSRLGDKNIDYAENGSYELIGESELTAINDIGRVNELLRPVLKTDAFGSADSKISDYGFAKNKVLHMVSNLCEGELNTGKMMRRLIDMSLAKGIEVKTGCDVLKIEEEAQTVKVVVNHGHLQQQIVFCSPKVAICTNAFTRHFYPLLDIQPGRGQVLVTKPLQGLKFKGIYHFDKGYYYFRRLGDRVLFGGGRNIDFQGEQTADFGFNDKIRQDLLHKLEHVIMPGQSFEIEDWWTGIMAFGTSKFPILIKQSSRIYLGVRMGGMGVAIGSEIGEQLADMLSTS